MSQSVQTFQSHGTLLILGLGYTIFWALEMATASVISENSPKTTYGVLFGATDISSTVTSPCLQLGMGQHHRTRRSGQTRGDKEKKLCHARVYVRTS